jgi:hypothetical protein
MLGYRGPIEAALRLSGVLDRGVAFGITDDTE